MDKKSKVNNGSYIVIQSFMITDLKLKGNKLLVYAIIYGFSQEENSKYTGSIQYLADWTNSTKQSIHKILKSLTDSNLIIKNTQYINGVKFCEYQSTKLIEVVNKVDRGSKQSLLGVVNKVDRGSKQSLPNNIEDNIVRYKLEDNIEDINVCIAQDPVPLANAKDPKSFSNTYIVDDHFKNAEVNVAFKDLLEHRKSLKIKNTDLAIKRIINILNEYEDKTKIKMIDNAIMNNWKSVYPLKQKDEASFEDKSFNDKLEYIKNLK